MDWTPCDDREFATPGDQGERKRMDLLSVLAHELGHMAGLDDEHDPGDVMGESLATGTRRLPSKADVRVALTADGLDFVMPARPAVVGRRRAGSRR